MDIILVDTSVWINFFKAIETKASLFLKNNLGNIIIATCPEVLQEVLQGTVSDKDFRHVHSYLNTLTQFRGEPYELAHDATELYRELRKKGITIRKANDCLVAIYAINNNVRLLHDDRDFDYIAENSNLIV